MVGETDSKRDDIEIPNASLTALRTLNEGFTAPVSIWLIRLKEQWQRSAILAKVRPYFFLSLRIATPISWGVGFILLVTLKCIPVYLEKIVKDKPHPQPGYGDVLFPRKAPSGLMCPSTQCAACASIARYARLFIGRPPLWCFCG